MKMSSMMLYFLGLSKLRGQFMLVRYASYNRLIGFIKNLHSKAE